MEKSAQLFGNLPLIEPEYEEDEKEKEEDIIDEMPDEAIRLQDILKEVNEDLEDSVEHEPEKEELIFKLDMVPGAVTEDDLVLDEDEDEVVEEEEPDADDWNWERGGTGNFLNWLQKMFKSVPQHSGNDTTGIERALAYFQKLDAEISKAMRKDYKREIDAAKAEEARSEIVKGMSRLLERLEKLHSKKFKKNKKSSEQTEFVKNAETSTVGRMVVNIPYLISNIARACIEATVQGGKDIEEVFAKLDKEYSLTKRERAQTVQLLKDMGYPMLLDRVNPFKDIKPSTTEASEFITQYYA